MDYELKTYDTLKYQFQQWCEDGQLLEAQQLVKQVQSELPDLSLVQQLYADGDRQAIIKLFKRVNAYTDNDFPSEAITANLFFDVCCKGHVEVAKWLKELVQDEDEEWDYQEAYIEACMNGHLEMAVWLSDRAWSDTSDYVNLIRETVISVCSKGYLAVAQHMFNSKEQLNINLRKQFDIIVCAYLAACRNGRRSVADWLRSLHPTELIHTYDEDTQQLHYSVCCHHKQKVWA
jgi:hypothetical protein